MAIALARDLRKEDGLDESLRDAFLGARLPARSR